MLPAFGVPRAAAGLPNQVNRQLVAAMPPPNQMPNQVNQQPVVPMLNPNMGPNAVVGCGGAGNRLDRRRRPNPPIPMVIGGNGDDEESLATVSVASSTLPRMVYEPWGDVPTLPADKWGSLADIVEVVFGPCPKPSA